MAYLNKVGLKYYDEKIKKYINDKIVSIDLSKYATKEELSDSIPDMSPYAKKDETLALSGGTVTGKLILDSYPMLQKQAVTKEYVDDALNKDYEEYIEVEDTGYSLPESSYVAFTLKDKMYVQHDNAFYSYDPDTGNETLIVSGLPNSYMRNCYTVHDDKLYYIYKESASVSRLFVFDGQTLTDVRGEWVNADTPKSMAIGTNGTIYLLSQPSSSSYTTLKSVNGGATWITGPKLDGIQTGYDLELWGLGKVYITAERYSIYRLNESDSTFTLIYDSQPYNPVNFAILPSGKLLVIWRSYYSYDSKSTTLKDINAFVLNQDDTLYKKYLGLGPRVDSKVSDGKCCSYKGCIYTNNFKNRIRVIKIERGKFDNE